jgi:ABC-type glycerol-3-phosphate transport system substrate-binding protein
MKICKAMVKSMVKATAIILVLSQFVTGCSSFNPSSDGKITDLRPQKIQLTVLAGQSTSDAGTEEMINTVIEKKFPNIQLNWECVDWGNQFASQMNAKFAAGDVPDIMIGKAQDVATFVDSGNLAQIPNSLLQYVSKNSLYSVLVNGCAFGIPYDADYQGVLYNKDTFKKYGLDVPTTKQELADIVQKLKASKIVPYASHFEESWYMGNIIMQFAMGEVFSNTTNWGDQFRKGNVSFSTSPEFAHCFSDVEDISSATWNDAFTTDETDCDERFANGEAAMYVTGTWSLQAINAVNPHVNIGIFPYPNQAGDAKLIYEPNMTFMISSKTAYPNEVNSVLQAILNNEDLFSEILDYTKTVSMLKDQKAEAPLLIQGDIDRYSLSDLLTDVTIGNRQLIWTYQNDLASRLDDWQLGKTSLSSVLKYADNNRSASAP